MMYGTESFPSSTSKIIEEGDIFGYYLGPAEKDKYAYINGFAEGTHLVLQKVTGDDSSKVLEYERQDRRGQIFNTS